jgi:Transposase DDE domain group 1
VSHAGVALLSELSDRSGLTLGLSRAMGSCGISWHTHDPGVVLSHLAVAVADGADCLSDMAVLREQTELFGPVASRPTAWRAMSAVGSVELRAIPVAVAAARERVWKAAGVDFAGLTLDFDATLVGAFSEKQDAAPTYKGGFGFHPFGVWCDETNEPLAVMLRPGNAGANNCDDHLDLFDAAIEGLPARYREGHMIGDAMADVVVPLLVRSDSAGASHGLVRAVLEANAEYSIGYQIDGRVRDALLLVQEEDWCAAVETDGTVRKGAFVTELTGLVEMGGWGAGCRLVCRRERPHPGAQLSIFDAGDGWRHTAFITNTVDSGIRGLELRHRGHARVEARVRCWKATGLANLPFEDYVRNEAWVAVSLLASCLIAWTQLVCLDGDLARAEPKTLRYRLFHVAARLAKSHRQLVLRIDNTWPWRDQLVTAFTRLRTRLC